MSRRIMVLNSLTRVRSSIANAAKEVYADRTDVDEGMLVRENMMIRRKQSGQVALRRKLEGNFQRSVHQRNSLSRYY